MTTVTEAPHLKPEDTETTAATTDASNLSAAIDAAFTHKKLSRTAAHDRVLAIAADLTDKITGADGTYTIAEENIMANYLPDGVTVEHLKAGDETQALVTAGIHRALGQVALKDMVANPSLEKVTGQFALREGVSMVDTIKREEVRDGMVRDGVKLPDTTTYGASRIVIKHQSADASVGEIGKARHWLNEAAEEAFKNL